MLRKSIVDTATYFSQKHQSPLPNRSAKLNSFSPEHCTLRMEDFDLRRLILVNLKKMVHLRNNRLQTTKKAYFNPHKNSST